MDPIAALNAELIECRLCPRLVEWREGIAREKRAAFRDQTYWGRPVPYFGDHDAARLIVGLAPAAHGANRTGRMFTGDRSGDFLFAALHRAGVASQPQSDHPEDGLFLKGALIAGTAHCAPPANKPTPDEVGNCSRYLTRLLATREWRSILCLGGIAWDHVHRLLKAPKMPFAHGAIHRLETTTLVATYHPSQQNTFTGRLTPAMIDAAIQTWLNE
ncbi:uracil-DNA glycosylase [bacterium]|nr:MAG: uracil-DNA glycosylase [bacterium]